MSVQSGRIRRQAELGVNIIFRRQSWRISRQAEAEAEVQAEVQAEAEVGRSPQVVAEESLARVLRQGKAGASIGQQLVTHLRR